MFRLSEGEWEKIPPRFKTRIDRAHQKPNDVALARVEIVPDTDAARRRHLYNLVTTGGSQ